ncbi:MAG: ABC transporter substrate-binding protein, partial [Thaumarchaeota archaeon]|nr:ABC transporter substrate-binding protein [Nitrososphaerota archaeon]
YTSFGTMSGLSFGCSADNCGKTYANGGFDAVFVGFGGGTPLPDFGTQAVVGYRSLTPADYAPVGTNFIYYHNDTYNQLSNAYNQQFNATARIPLAQQMVRIVAQDRPDLPIYQPVDSYIMANYISPSGNNVSESSATANRDYQYWKLLGGNTQLNIAETGDINSLNQWINSPANTYYDAYNYNPTFAFTERLDGASLNYVNDLATSISSSADHLTWNIAFTAHNWQDGVPVTSDDYVFTTIGSVVNDVGFVGSGTLQTLLGNFGPGVCNCSQIQFKFLNGTSDYVVNGVYSHGAAPAGFTATSVWTSLTPTTFSFTMSQPYLFTDPLITAISANPMHIFEKIPFTGYATSQFATLHTSPYVYTWDAAKYGGNGSATAYGPIGDGAYYYHGYDTVANVGTLVAWPGYWQTAALKAQGLFNIQTIHVSWIAGKDAALASFGNGQVNFLDSNYAFVPADFAVGAANHGKSTQRSSPSAGWQDFSLQNTHPVFGTGVATPKGQTDPAHAASYARMVREALSHMIPRQYIIDYLLQGQGSIGITEFCTCFAFAYPADIKPDSFDLTLAKSLLAQAGYNTGTSGTIVLPPPPSVSCGTSPGSPGANVTVPSFLSGNTLSLSGTFAVPSAQGHGTGGFFTTLQESTDSGTSWTPVGLTIATEGGYYNFAYAPKVTGPVWYRVFFTGIPSTSTLGATGPNSPSAPEAYVPPQAPGDGEVLLNITNTHYSAVTSLTVGTLSEVIASALASLSQTDAVAIHNAACGVADSTNAAIGNLSRSTSSAFTQLQTSAASKTDLQNAVNSINATITNVSYISYAALAVAIILGLVAIMMARRKPS